MNPFVAGGLTFLSSIGGALIGLGLAGRLPERHRDEPTKDVVRISMAIVATLSALVLGLLIGSAKQSFDNRATELKELASQSLFLDRTLAVFGPESRPARLELRAVIAARLKDWSSQLYPQWDPEKRDQGETISDVQTQILALEPKTDAQRWLKEKALDISSQIAQARWLLIEEGMSSIQWPFLIVLMFWLASMFGSFALFAARNATVVVALTIAALAIGSSIFVIIETDDPYGGLIRLADTPMRKALSELGGV
jgi:hypothetical protein